MLGRLPLTLVVALTLALAAAGRAQPLIERVPDGALVYVGWAGTDAARDAYLQSTLKPVVDEMRPERVRESFDRAVRALAVATEDEPEVAEVMNVVLPALGAGWRSPTALYVLEPGMTPQPADGPGVVVMWRPSPADRPALLEALQTLEQRLDDDDVALTATAEQFTLAFNAPAPAAANDGIAERGAAGLAASDRFAAVMQGLGRADEPALITAYVDLPRLIELAVQTADEHGADDRLFAVLDALKVDRLGATGYAAAFDGKDWATRVFLAAPAPREGLAAMLDAPTLTDEHLALVPRDTTRLAAGTFDTGRLVDLARQSAQAVGPDAADRFEQALAQVSGMLGVNVEERLLRGLGPAWLAYSSPDALGDSIMGLTVVNPLADAEGVDMALRSLEAVANALIAQQLADEENLNIRFHTVQRDGVTLHQLGTPLVSPTWAVHDGKLIVGLYPQAVLAAAAGLGEGGSILDGDAFAAARPDPGLVGGGGGRVTGVSFVDLPTTARGGYASLVMLESLATGGTSLATGAPVPSVLPPLRRLMPHVRPMGGTAWVDDAGFTAAGRAPFPSAGLLDLQSGAGTTTVVPMMVGILMPALGAARRNARQMDDSTRAQGIHQAMIVQARTKPSPPGGGDRPLITDIGQLILDNYITPNMTVSEASATTLPAAIPTWPLQEQADWVRANADFIIVPGLVEDLDFNTIALFLRPGIYNDPGEPGRGTVTHNDNATEFEADYDLIEAQLIEQTGMTMDELIARQEALAEPANP